MEQDINQVVNDAITQAEDTEATAVKTVEKEAAKDGIITVDPNGSITVHVPDVPIAQTSGIGLLLLLGWSALNKYVIQPNSERVLASFSYTVNAEQQMLSVVTRILAKTDADRVMLYLPHNGTTFMNGLHQWKLSCKTEVVAPGIVNIKHKAQNIDIGTLINTAHLVQDKGVYVYKVNDSENYPALDYFTSYICSQGGTQTSIVVPIKGDKDKFGILDLHYVRNGDIDPKTELEQIKKECLELSVIISNSKEPWYAPYVRKLSGK